MAAPGRKRGPDHNSPDVVAELCSLWRHVALAAARHEMGGLSRRVIVHLGGEAEIESAAMFALWDAARLWRADGGASISTLIRFAVGRRIRRLVKKSFARGSRPLSSLHCIDADGEPYDLPVYARPDWARDPATREEIATRLRMLPRRQRWMVEQRAYGLSLKEIACQAGVSRQRVLQELQRANAKLQRRFASLALTE